LRANLLGLAVEPGVCILVVVRGLGKIVKLCAAKAGGERELRVRVESESESEREGEFVRVFLFGCLSCSTFNSIRDPRPNKKER
jgi:hypothetical protein